VIKLEKLAIVSHVFDLAKKNGLISIAGKSGTGKTTLALQFVSTLMTLEKPYRNQCVWIQASEQFPKKRLRSLLKSYPDKVNYVLKNIFVAPGIKPFSNYQEQSAYFRRLNTIIFPNNVKVIVIDNISHHLRFAASSHSNFKKRGAILDEFFSVQLFPLIMRCLREKIILILIHEVSFDPTSDKTKPFFSKLYDRIDSINVYLSKVMGSGLKQMEISSKVSNSMKFIYEISESGIINL
jgi:archaellum biogenesis ATPase FlaH